MQLPDDWRRYVAPAAFLLAVTIAVVLIRAGFESGNKPQSAPSQPASVTTSAPPPATTTGTTTVAATKQFWTVKAGDSYGVISSQTGVPVATLEQLNPTVKSTSLFIGERIRIK
jgi:LysM repeat protein